MGRLPSPDESKLWRAATGDVRRRRAASIPPPPPPPARPREATVPVVAPRGGGLDRRSALRLKRGQMAIEARLDLHGMTQEPAHRVLTKFIARAYDEGRRTLLIVTGKGTGEGTGVLRQAVPRWLDEPLCRAAILAIEEAQPKDGGAGALYVLLRRRR